MLHQAALGTALAGCAAIIAIGARFLLLPRQATVGFGVQPGNVRALTAIKGIRDITSGVVPLVVWWQSDSRVFGCTMLAASLTPTCDAIVVLTNGGKTADALGIHGVTAGVLVAAGLVLLMA